MNYTILLLLFLLSQSASYTKSVVLVSSFWWYLLPFKYVKCHYPFLFFLCSFTPGELILWVLCKMAMCRMVMGIKWWSFLKVQDCYICIPKISKKRVSVVKLIDPVKFINKPVKFINKPVKFINKQHTTVFYSSDIAEI